MVLTRRVPRHGGSCLLLLYVQALLSVVILKEAQRKPGLLPLLPLGINMLCRGRVNSCRQHPSKQRAKNISNSTCNHQNTEMNRHKHRKTEDSKSRFKVPIYDNKYIVATHAGTSLVERFHNFGSWLLNQLNTSSRS